MTTETVTPATIELYCRVNRETDDRQPSALQRDRRHIWLCSCHLHAARDEQTEREGEKETLVDRAFEEQSDETLEIHRTTD